MNSTLVFNYKNLLIASNLINLSSRTRAILVRNSLLGTELPDFRRDHIWSKPVEYSIKSETLISHSTRDIIVANQS